MISTGIKPTIRTVLIRKIADETNFKHYSNYSLCREEWFEFIGPLLLLEVQHSTVILHRTLFKHEQLLLPLYFPSTSIPRKNLPKESINVIYYSYTVLNTAGNITYFLTCLKQWIICGIVEKSSLPSNRKLDHSSKAKCSKVSNVADIPFILIQVFICKLNPKLYITGIFLDTCFQVRNVISLTCKIPDIIWSHHSIKHWNSFFMFCGMGCK